MWHKSENDICDIHFIDTFDNEYLELILSDKICTQMCAYTVAQKLFIKLHLI